MLINAKTLKISQAIKYVIKLLNSFSMIYFSLVIRTVASIYKFQGIQNSNLKPLAKDVVDK